MVDVLDLRTTCSTIQWSKSQHGTKQYSTQHNSTEMSPRVIATSISDKEHPCLVRAIKQEPDDGVIVTMTHAEKSHIHRMKAWPYRQE